MDADVPRSSTGLPELTADVPRTSTGFPELATDVKSQSRNVFLRALSTVFN